MKFVSQEKKVIESPESANMDDTEYHKYFIKPMPEKNRKTDFLNGHLYPVFQVVGYLQPDQRLQPRVQLSQLPDHPRGLAQRNRLCRNLNKKNVVYFNMKLNI